MTTPAEEKPADRNPLWPFALWFFNGATLEQLPNGTGGQYTCCAACALKMGDDAGFAKVYDRLLKTYWADRKEHRDAVPFAIALCGGHDENVRREMGMQRREGPR